MSSNIADKTITELKELIEFYKSKNYDELERSHVAKYLAVLISGYYEGTIKQIIQSNASKQNLPAAYKEHLSKQLKHFRNPDFNKVVGLIKSFSKEASNKLSKETKEDVKVAFTSIVNNKNLIAHGRACTITFLEIEDFFNKSTEIIKKIEEIVDKFF